MVFRRPLASVPFRPKNRWRQGPRQGDLARFSTVRLCLSLLQSGTFSAPSTLRGRHGFHLQRMCSDVRTNLQPRARISRGLNAPSNSPLKAAGRVGRFAP